MQQVKTKQDNLQSPREFLALTKIKKELGYSMAEIFESLNSQAFCKMLEYKSKMERYEKKYQMEFPEFKKQLENATATDNFEEEDDFIFWEGYYEMYILWKSKYNALTNYVF